MGGIGSGIAREGAGRKLIDGEPRMNILGSTPGGIGVTPSRHGYARQHFHLIAYYRIIKERA